MSNGTDGADLIVYADYACPFCYLADAALAPLRAEGVRIESRAFELRPAPVPLPGMHEPYFRTGWTRGVVPLARDLGVHGLRQPRFATRTRKAHEAAAFAREHGAGDAMHRALYEAYFVEQRDIGRIDVLVAIGAAAGLDGLALRIALDVDRYAEQVVAQEAEARRLGITAVPAHLARADDGRYRLMTGVRATDELRALIGVGSAAGTHEDEDDE
jgi:predicted DsbA family dithiol-disulfide isomerase